MEEEEEEEGGEERRGGGGRGVLLVPETLRQFNSMLALSWLSFVPLCPPTRLIGRP